MSTNLVDTFNEKCQISPKTNTIESLADLQVLKKFLDNSSQLSYVASSMLSELTTADLLIYVMINETEVFKVLPVSKQTFQKSTEYFSSLLDNQNSSTFRSLEKHPELNVEISCLKVPEASVNNVFKCLKYINDFENNSFVNINSGSTSLGNNTCEPPFTPENAIELYKIFDFLGAKVYIGLADVYLQDCVNSTNVFELSKLSDTLEKICKEFVLELEVESKNVKVGPTIYVSSSNSNQDRQVRNLKYKCGNLQESLDEVKQFVSDNLNFLQCPDCERHFALPYFERRVIGRTNTTVQYTTINCPFENCAGNDLVWPHLEQTRYANTDRVDEERDDFVRNLDNHFDFEADVLEYVSDGDEGDDEYESDEYESESEEYGYDQQYHHSQQQNNFNQQYNNYNQQYNNYNRQYNNGNQQHNNDNRYYNNDNRQYNNNYRQYNDYQRNSYYRRNYY